MAVSVLPTSGYNFDCSTLTPYADGSIHSSDPTALLDPARTGGFLMFRRSMNETTDAASSITIVVDRVIEPHVTCVGTASCDLSFSDYCNPTASRLSIASQSLSWADGELGPKTVTVAISATAYTGAELYNLSLTSASGASIHAWDTTYPSSGTEARWLEYNAYLKISSATLATGATYADDATATDYTTPVGTVGDPKKLLTAIYEATAGDVIYMRAGTYSETGTPFSRGIGTETSTEGTMILKNSGTVNSGIWLLPYPAEVVTIDPNDNPGAAQPGGYYGGIVGRGVSYWVLDGDGTTTITDCQNSGVQFSETSFRNIAHDLSITNIDDSNAGNNPGGVKFNTAYDNVISNNTITTVTLASAVQKTGGHSNNAGIMTFYAYGNVIENNTISESNSGYYNKFVPNADHAMDIIRGNIIHDVAFGLYNSGNNIVTFPRSLYQFIYENLLYTMGTECYETNLFNSTLYDSGHSWIWNNTFSGECKFFSLQEPLIWNNLFSATTAIVTRATIAGYNDDPNVFNNNTKIRYLNYDGYVGATTLISRLFDETDATTLAAVQAIDGTAIDFHADVGSGEIEANGFTDTVANCFTNAAAFDFTLKAGLSNALAAGKNGEDCGCYADAYSTVGVQ